MYTFISVLRSSARSAMKLRSEQKAAFSNSASKFSTPHNSPAAFTPSSHHRALLLSHSWSTNLSPHHSPPNPHLFHTSLHPHHYLPPPTMGCFPSKSSPSAHPAASPFSTPGHTLSSAPPTHPQPSIPRPAMSGANRTGADADARHGAATGPEAGTRGGAGAQDARSAAARAAEVSSTSREADRDAAVHVHGGQRGRRGVAERCSKRRAGHMRVQVWAGRCMSPCLQGCICVWLTPWGTRMRLSPSALLALDMPAFCSCSRTEGQCSGECARQRTLADESLCDCRSERRVRVTRPKASWARRWRTRRRRRGRAR